MAIRGLDSILKKLRGITNVNPALDAGGAEAARLVVKRTIKEGKDWHGQPFKPYAKGTKTYRQKRGRQTDQVDLVDTGKMIASISNKTSGNRAVVYFTDASMAKIAFYLHFGTPKMPARQFFGLTDEERRKVKELMQRKIAQNLK